MTEETFDAERICRICLREQDKLFLIHDESPIEHSLNLVQILNECTSYKVVRYDKMPHQMCAGCIDDARAAYRFKRKAAEAYRKLLDIYGSIAPNNKENYVDNGTQTEHSSLYPCEVCDEKFFSSDELRHHRSVEHQNKLKCKICGEEYDKIRLLQLHQAQTHQVQSTVTANLQCKICERSFSRRDHVVRHMRNVHQKSVYEQTKVTDKDQEEMECLSFLEEPEMIVMTDGDTELGQQHTVEQQNKQNCKECGKVYDNLRLLQLHQVQAHQAQHKETANLQCTICERSFSRSDHVLRHMRNVHQKSSINEQTKVNDKDQEEIECLTLLEEPEMIVMTDTGTAGLVPYTSQQRMSSNSESEMHYVDDYETNPISCDDDDDDESKPCVSKAQQHKLFVDMEPELNAELMQTNKADMKSANNEHNKRCHKAAGLVSNHQCNVCQRKFGRECHLQRHMQSMHGTTRHKSKLTKLKNTDNQTKSKKSDSDDSESSDDYTRPDDADTQSLYNGNSEPDDDDGGENTMAGLATQENFQVKTERVEAVDANTFTTALDIADIPLKLEETECKQEILLDADTEMLNATTEQNVTETNSKKVVKNRNKKVEIVREYLQKKRTTRKQRNDENPDNRCDLCQRTFSRHCHLLRHKLSHLEQKPHSCPHCPKTFARSDHLKAHVTSLHGNKDYKCTVCEAAFSRADALERHKLSKHDGAVVDGNGHGSAIQIDAKLHACEYCEKKFTSKSYLRKHTLIHTDLLYACKSCDMTFKERQQLREHEKTHTSERNFLCCICGDSFARNDYLRVHMRRHNGEKPYKCRYCCKGFPRATDVKVHERYHTGTKPNVCTLCNKGFHRAYNLTIHMRTHTGERPYKCDQCPKSFTQSNDLKAHIRRHTGERYKCNECEACFLQLYAMRHHALSVHGTHIQSKTGRLQRTGLYDDPQTQPQITTVLVAPLNYEPTDNQTQQQQLQQQQQVTTTALTQLNTQNSEDNSARSFASSSVDTVVMQPVSAQATLAPEYLSEYTVDLPSAILRFPTSIGSHQTTETQPQQHT